MKSQNILYPSPIRGYLFVTHISPARDLKTQFTPINALNGYENAE